jgi:hypothetical protein
VGIYFIGLKGSKDIFRKSQQVSACTSDRNVVYKEIFQKGGPIWICHLISKNDISQFGLFFWDCTSFEKTIANFKWYSVLEQLAHIYIVLPLVTCLELFSLNWKGKSIFLIVNFSEKKYIFESYLIDIVGQNFPV